MKSIIAISNNLYDEIFVGMDQGFIFIRDKDELTVDNLEQIRPEYIFFPHWSYIIPEKIYANFNCVIFHMTDLPFGRGGSPLQNLLARGIYQTKISAIKCSKGIDTGDVFLKKDFDISNGSAYELYREAGCIVKSMILEILERNPVPVAQSGEVVCFGRRKPEESNLAEVNSLAQVYDYIRMLDAPGYPKAFIESECLKFDFSDAEIVDGEVVARVIIRDKNDKK